MFGAEGEASIDGLKGNGVSNYGLRDSEISLHEFRDNGVFEEFRGSENIPYGLRGNEISSDTHDLPHNDDEILKQIFGGDNSDDDHADVKIYDYNDNSLHKNMDLRDNENEYKSQNNQMTSTTERLFNRGNNPDGGNLRFGRETDGVSNNVNKGNENNKFNIEFNDDFNDIFGSSKSASTTSSRSVSTPNSLSHSPSPSPSPETYKQG